MKEATTIDEVIEILEKIQSDAITKQDPLGYFTTLYLEVTRNVKQGIADGEFEDGPRMERLDVIFANRYLAAYDAYQQGQPCSACWKVAFDAAKNDKLIVLQHLIVGINAHINLDLGIAAAETVGHSDLNALKGDFDKINDLLAKLLDVVEKRLSKIWWALGLIDKWVGDLDRKIGNFSIEIARKSAWNVAQQIHSLSGTAKDNKIKEIDGIVTLLGEKVTITKGFLNILQMIIRVTEVGSNSQKIRHLEGRG